MHRGGLALVAAVAVVLATPPTSSSSSTSSAFLVPWSLSRVGRVIASRLGVRAAAAAAASTDSAHRPPAGATSSPELLEASLNASQLIMHWGYPAETHSIQTEDGYILTLQRIPWGRYGPGTGSRPAVLLQHGLMQSADQWLLRGPDKDLALLLADLGYDVWLGNYRGNAYARSHVTLQPDSDQFWDFSWHENGYYDLASTIDYVLAVTEQPSLFFIGHSMGTTTLLVLLSERPEYNSRIRVAFMLAPVAYFSQLRGLLSVALPLFRQLDNELRSIHREMLPRGFVPRSLVTAYCSPDSPTLNLCMSAYFQVAGPDRAQLNSTLFPVIMSHIPAGSSLGQFTHYAQVFKSGVFRQFDRGIRENTLRYGWSQPPKYNLANIVAPINFHYSTGDYLAHFKDVERLISEVPGTAGVYKIPLKEFNHGDYMWAIDSYDLLYKTIVKLMPEY